MWTEGSWRRHATRLVGRRITGLVLELDADVGAIPGLELDDRTVLFVLSDPEGNGPGFLDVRRPDAGAGPSGAAT